jgi:SAM-dependent methyltransferase
MFGSDYASTYDEVYAAKDYEGECAMIEHALAVELGPGPYKLLDLGCGTGGHSVPLARRGHSVRGVDISPAMLAVARAKPGGGSVEFVYGDIRYYRMNERYDAVLILFAVLGYMTAEDDVLAAVRTARAALRPGGIVIFDGWWEEAVRAQGLSERERVIATAEGPVRRHAAGHLDEARGLCVVDIELTRDGANENRALLTREQHAVRFFNRRGLERVLTASGFALTRLGALPDIERAPDQTTWSFVCVARAERTTASEA